MLTLQLMPSMNVYIDGTEMMFNYHHPEYVYEHFPITCYSNTVFLHPSRRIFLTGIESTNTIFVDLLRMQSRYQQQIKCKYIWP